MWFALKPLRASCTLRVRLITPYGCHVSAVPAGGAASSSLKASQAHSRPLTCLSTRLPHTPHSYATWDWWRLFAPSQRRAMANATSSGHRRQRQLLLDDAAASAPSRNLSFLYADWADIAADVAQSGGSRDAAGFGGLYLHALWHATHSPNIATDMQSPTTVRARAGRAARAMPLPTQALGHTSCFLARSHEPISLAASVRQHPFPWPSKAPSAILVTFTLRSIPVSL